MKSYTNLPVKKETFFCQHTGSVPLKLWGSTHLPFTFYIYSVNH